VSARRFAGLVLCGVAVFMPLLLLEG